MTAKMSSSFSSGHGANDCLPGSGEMQCSTADKGHYLIENRPYWEVDLGDDASVFKVEIDSLTHSNFFSRNMEVQLLSKDDVVLANFFIGSFGTSQTKTITAHEDGTYHFERNHCIKKCQDEAKVQLQAEQTK